MSKENGLIRLLYKDPLGSVIPPLFECESRIMSDQETDPTKQVIMPFVNRPIFKEGDQLVIWFQSEVADKLTLEATDGTGTQLSKIKIPATFRNTRTGVIARGYVVTDDFAQSDGNTPGQASAADFAAGIGREWLYYTIPAGVELKLGHKYAFNSRIMISPYDDVS